MILDNSLVIGIVLIGIGLSLAAIVYVVFSRRRSEDETEEGEPSPYEDMKADIPEIVEPEIPTHKPVSAPRPPSIEPEPLRDTPPQTPVIPSPTPEPQRANRRRIPVATLLRDEVSGDIIVKVGDREYRTIAELRLSDDLTRVEFAASDLAKWFSKTPADQRTSEPDQELVTQKPDSMIGQINAILQEKLTDQIGGSKAVRLIEGPGGAVRVLIGVHSFNLDDVPDGEVSKLIREAVTAWEESQ
jgi:hypothetical protein